MSDQPADPLAAFGDLYLKGLAAFQSAAGSAGEEQSGRPGTQGFNPAAMLPAGTPPEVAAALTDAWRISATSALRYGQALMAVQLRYQAALLHAMSDRANGRAAEPLVLADNARAFVREIGETAEREARRLHLELDQVSEALAQALAQPGDPADPARRAYRAKA
ncbi:hypothetical protein AruPA_04365 [Acidiphilium sp. PA]|uniref:hypothetical protein n=1 Tax=Acidiphilium sp. PA TaxID=2871705 RepID=UPI0022433889|nr:hypothetical protein [Acidiphilium sp. PA]MCW8306262.1 hypothetical protein [Acidiphilium sp. PA]